VRPVGVVTDAASHHGGTVRLLDKVSQCRGDLLVAHDSLPGDVRRLTGAADYAASVSACALRYVLSDDVTRAAAELAFCGGDRLAACLDLVRFPSETLWIEWNDEIHHRVLKEAGASPGDPRAPGRQVGMILKSSRDGLSAVGRTLWSDPASDGPDGLTLSPVETHIDLVESGGRAAPRDFVEITDAEDKGVAALLGRARFRFDDLWADYYARVARDPAVHRRVLDASLEGVVRDVPLLLSFLLLLSARSATRAMPVDRAVVNAKRRRTGRALLLDHVEVHEALEDTRPGEVAGSSMWRRPSRLHHVRGHLVRRGNVVYWRCHHVRGRTTAGAIQSRTVRLTFERGSRAAGAQSRAWPASTRGLN
jgi:hypothetical protein